MVTEVHITTTYIAISKKSRPYSDIILLEMQISAKAAIYSTLPVSKVIWKCSHLIRPFSQTMQNSRVRFYDVS